MSESHTTLDFSKSVGGHGRRVKREVLSLLGDDEEVLLSCASSYYVAIVRGSASYVC